MIFLHSSRLKKKSWPEVFEMTQYTILPYLLLYVSAGVIPSLNIGECAEYYIKSSEDDTDCPSYPIQPCLSISQLSAHLCNTIVESEVLHLYMLPGNHGLHDNITFSQLDYLKIFSNATVNVTCDLSSHVMLDNIQNVVMHNLRFFGCGNTVVSNIESFILYDTAFEGSNASPGTFLVLSNTTAEIINSSFSKNQYGTLTNNTWQFLMLLRTSLNWLITGHVPNTVQVGGALISSFSHVNISNSTFCSNRAEAGGDIFAVNFSTISITASTFIEKNELLDVDRPLFGGAIFVYESTLQISSCHFRNKQATIGGAIIMSYSYLKVTNTDFLSNHAIDHGASLFMYKTDATISGCNFICNTAGAGAAIANQEGMSTTIEACSFISNRAIRHAAALEFYKDHPRLIGCVFIDNIAGSFAGAVLFWFSDSVIYGGIVSNESMEACNCNDVSVNYYYHGIRSYCNNSAHSQFRNNYHEKCTLFISNSARTAGALYAIKSSLKSLGCIVFSNNNSTLSSTVHLLDSNGTFEGWTEMSRNVGSFFAFYSNLTFKGSNTFVNSQFQRGWFIFTSSIGPISTW